VEVVSESARWRWASTLEAPTSAWERMAQRRLAKLGSPGRCSRAATAVPFARIVATIVPELPEG